MMRSASTNWTVPERCARTTIPEFWATGFSMPVATIGGSGFSSGTAWRCMLEPMSARFASLCSRNGMRLALTPSICFGEMSMYSSFLVSTSMNSPL